MLLNQDKMTHYQLEVNYFNQLIIKLHVALVMDS